MVIISENFIESRISFYVSCSVKVYNGWDELEGSLDKSDN